MARLDSNQQIPALSRLPHYLGTIVATTTAEDNSTTADDFDIPAGALVVFQPDAACYVSAEFDASAITADNALLFGANELVTGMLWSTETKLAAKAVSGTVNVKVFLLAK